MNMLSYEYRIERDEGTRTAVFVPKAYPRDLPNLVVLQGPNSSGKSTLLNIIALGLYGDKHGVVDESLKWKIQRLRTSPYQKVTFKFTIEWPEDDYSLTCEKADGSRPDVRVTEIKKGKIGLLTAESLQERVRLIYDIPVNPTERIMNVVDEAVYVQNSFLNIVARLRVKLTKILEDIENSQDPSALARLEMKVGEHDKKLRDLKDTLELQKARLSQVEALQAIRGVQKARENLISINKRIASIQTRQATIEKSARRQDKRIEQLERTVNEKVELIRVCQSKIHDLLGPIARGPYTAILRSWDEFDCESIRRDRRIPVVLGPLLHGIRAALEDVRKTTSTQQTAEVKIYRELLEFLKKYREVNIEFPGAGVPLKAVIDALEQRCNDLMDYEIEGQKLEQISQFVDTVNDSIKYLEGPLDDLRKAGQDGGNSGEELDDIETLQERTKDLHVRRSATEKELRQWEGICATKGLPLESLDAYLPKLFGKDEISRYRALSDTELEREVASIRRLVETTETNRRNREIDFHMDKKELERLEKKKPHELRNRADDLDHLLRSTTAIETSLRQAYSEMANKAKKPDPEEWKDHAHRTYSKALGSYLATRIRRIRHIDGEYDVKMVDVANRLVESTNGVKIHFDDMGTGQGQSAYLQSVLGKEDPRRMIVLIDEVAMMDSKSSEPIYKRLRELHATGKLLLGVVVQKGDEPKVSDLSS